MSTATCDYIPQSRLLLLPPTTTLLGEQPSGRAKPSAAVSASTLLLNYLSKKHCMVLPDFFPPKVLHLFTSTKRLPHLGHQCAHDLPCAHLRQQGPHHPQARPGRPATAEAHVLPTPDRNGRPRSRDVHGVGCLSVGPKGGPSTRTTDGRPKGQLFVSYLVVHVFFGQALLFAKRAHCDDGT